MIEALCCSPGPLHLPALPRPAPRLPLHPFPQEAFTLSITTWPKPDRGFQENVHELDGDKLKRREVVNIDIANDPIRSSVGVLSNSPPLQLR